MGADGAQHEWTGGLGMVGWPASPTTACGVRPMSRPCTPRQRPAAYITHRPGIPTRVGRFAAQVARHYPWVDAFTPVNEPLTTARFSCLYGHWYPHSRHDSASATALLNQCRAIVMSMAAIRQINPAAALVQTEDFGHTHAPPRLAYQAEFENQRRWILGISCVDAWAAVTRCELFQRSHLRVETIVVPGSSMPS